MRSSFWLSSRRRGVLLAALLMSASVSAVARWSDQQPIELSGVVVRADDPSVGLGGAVVTLESASLGMPFNTITRRDGRFVFPLPATARAMRVTLTAAKPSFLTTSYGATRPGRKGVSIAIDPGQRPAQLTIALPLGAVVSGRVVDEAARPLRDVVVAVVPAAWQSTSAPPQQARTDALGRFRIYGLWPGAYLVATVVSLPGQGVIERLPAQRLANAPIFWPGTSRVTDARVVDVGVGEERGGVDIVWRPSPAITVSGTLTTADGSPMPGVDLSLTRVGPRLPVQWGADPRRDPNPADPARFTFSAVAPDVYLLVARPAHTSIGLWAMREVDASAGDVSGLVLELRPASSLKGRVALGSAPAPQGAVRQVVLKPDTTAFNWLGSRTTPEITGNVAPDGTFEVASIRPGTYSLDVVTDSRFAGSLRAVRFRGRDILDERIVFDGRDDLDEVTIELAAGRSDLRGRLLRSDRGPASEYDVIVLPQNSAARRPGSRRIRSTRPGTDGIWEFRDLLPGDYVIGAATDVREEDLRDPGFLDAVAAMAVKVHIGDSGVHTVDLRAGG